MVSRSCLGVVSRWFLNGTSPEELTYMLHSTLAPRLSCTRIKRNNISIKNNQEKRKSSRQEEGKERGREGRKDGRRKETNA